MQFKYPEVLFFLFLLLIPLLIHLFHLQRFKKQSFTNVKFLKEIELETRRSSKLKKLLILLTRLLAFASLIFAFAQPFINKNKNLQKRAAIYYFDNSFSMQVKSNSGIDQLQLNKNYLLDNTQDIYESKTLLTNNELKKNLDTKSFNKAVVKLDFHPVRKSINQVLLEIKNQIRSTENTSYDIYLFSDFQEINDAIDSSLFDLNQEYNLIRPSNSNQKNLSIDSVWVADRDADFISLQASINSHQITVDDLSVSLYLNEDLFGKTTISLDQNSSDIIEFKIPSTGPNFGKLSISDQFLNFDNDLFFSIPKRAQTKILIIGPKSDVLNRIYPAKNFELLQADIEQLDQSNIASQDLILLNEVDHISNPLMQSLQSFVGKGGKLVVIPAIDLNLENYNLLLAGFNAGSILSSFHSIKRINTINYEHPFYNKVFDKRVFNFQYPMIGNGYLTKFSNANPLLQYEDLSHFASEIPFKEGTVFFISAPLSPSNNSFSNSPLIVPLFYNFSLGEIDNESVYLNIGSTNHMIVETNKIKDDQPLKIVRGQEEFIPIQTKKNNKIEITTREFPNSSGIYDFQYQDESLMKISFNIDRSESKLAYQSLSSIEKKYQNIHLYNSINKAVNDVNERNNNKNLWQLFIIFALVFLVMEILLQKFLKN